jgi:hypothetical protein
MGPYFISSIRRTFASYLVRNFQQMYLMRFVRGFTERSVPTLETND